MVGVIVLIHAVLTYLESPFLLDDSHIRLAGKGLVISRRGWAVLALLFVFGILLAGAGTRYMRPDEAIAFDGTGGTIASTIAYQAADVHAPLYFVGFHLWQQVAGDGELAGRYFSLLQSLLTAALVFHLGRRWFRDWWFGVAALLALGLSSYFFKYAVEIRPYATVMLVATLSMLAFAEWMRLRTWRWAALYGLSVVAMLYLHYFGVFLMLAQGIYLLGVLVVDRRSAPDRAGLRLIGQAAAAYAGAFVLWLPWFPTFLAQVRHVGQLVPESQTQIAGLGMAGTTFATNWPTLLRFLQIATNGLPLLAVPVLLVGLVLLRRRRAYWLAFAWGIGLPVLMFLVNLVVPVYEPRYAATLVPGLGMLFGVSVLMLPVRRKAISLAVLVAVGLLTVSSAAGSMTPIRDHLRALEAAFQPGDTVVTVGLPSNLMSRYNFTHYAPTAAQYLYMADQGATFIAPPMQPWEGTDADLSRCFWYGTSSWYSDPGVTARFAELEAVRPVMQTAGDPAGYLFQRMCLPPEEAPHVFGDDDNVLTFLGADVLLTEADVLEVVPWWTVDTQPARDYSFGVYLLDGAGALVAQQDGPLMDYWSGDSVPTTAFAPEGYIVGRRQIALPAGLPSGEYTLALAVYQPEDGVRLAVSPAAQYDLLRVTTLSLP